MTEQKPHDAGSNGRAEPKLPTENVADGVDLSAGNPAGAAANTAGATTNTAGAAASAIGQVDTAAAGAPVDLAAVLQELEASKAKATENYDLYLRSVAEMENIRRRSAEDVSKAHKYAVESFAEAMVPVRDSLEMAMKVDKPTTASLLEGVEATLRQLAAAFERNRLLEVSPLGEKFDPNKHQAISMVPGNSVNPPVAANHVVAVLQKGYLINDRILRPALVTVAQG